VFVDKGFVNENPNEASAQIEHPAVSASNKILFVHRAVIILALFPEESIQWFGVVSKSRGLVA
jgi:hypothetical protein